MSNIFVTSIVGTGTYAVPSTDSELAAATVGLDAHINSIANLNYLRVFAWVETRDGVGASRILNCLIENFTYNGEVCPDATEINALTAVIKAELEGDANISSIGNQNVSIFTAAAYALWSRNSVGGYLYPTTTTDDIAVGAGPNSMWFDDGDLVLGAAAMSGTEKLRVVGTSYFEHSVGVNTVPVSSIGVDVETLSSGTTIYGIRAYLNTTGNVTTAWYGFSCRGVVNTGDTVSSLYSFYADVPTVNGSVDKYYSFYAVWAPPNVVNAYGLFIEDMWASNLRYGIYQVGSNDDNYFAGKVGIADDTPSYELDVNGDINVRTGNVYRFAGTQVANSRKTGWAAATGTADRATFNTGTVTLSELAERVKSLIDDFMSHGLIGT